MTKPRSPETKLKASVAIKARHLESKEVRQEIAQMSLTPAIHNKQLTEGIIETILVRLACGDSEVAVCELFGVSSGSFFQRVYTDDALMVRWRNAREMCAHSLYGHYMREAFNNDDDPKRSALKMRACEFGMRMLNRADYSERLQIDQRQAVQILLSDDTTTKL